MNSLSINNISSIPKLFDPFSGKLLIPKERLKLIDGIFKELSSIKIDSSFHDLIPRLKTLNSMLHATSALLNLPDENDLVWNKGLEFFSQVWKILQVSSFTKEIHTKVYSQIINLLESLIPFQNNLSSSESVRILFKDYETNGTEIIELNGINWIILKESSPYFKSLFSPGMKENRLREVTFDSQEIKKEDLLILLNHLVNGSIPGMSEDILNILALANRFGIQNLETRYIETINKYLKDKCLTHEEGIKDYINLFEFAFTHNIYKLQEKINLRLAEKIVVGFNLFKFDLIDFNKKFSTHCYLTNLQPKIFLALQHILLNKTGEGEKLLKETGVTGTRAILFPDSDASELIKNTEISDEIMDALYYGIVKGDLKAIAQRYDVRKTPILLAQAFSNCKLNNDYKNIQILLKNTIGQRNNVPLYNYLYVIKDLICNGVYKDTEYFNNNPQNLIMNIVVKLLLGKLDEATIDISKLSDISEISYLKVFLNLYQNRSDIALELISKLQPVEFLGKDEKFNFAIHQLIKAIILYKLGLVGTANELFTYNFPIVSNTKYLSFVINPLIYSEILSLALDLGSFGDIPINMLCEIDNQSFLSDDLIKKMFKYMMDKSLKIETFYLKLIINYPAKEDSFSFEFAKYLRTPKGKTSVPHASDKVLKFYTQKLDQNHVKSSEIYTTLILIVKELRLYGFIDVGNSDSNHFIEQLFVLLNKYKHKNINAFPELFFYELWNHKPLGNPEIIRNLGLEMLKEAPNQIEQELMFAAANLTEDKLEEAEKNLDLYDKNSNLKSNYSKYFRAYLYFKQNKMELAEKEILTNLQEISENSKKGAKIINWMIIKIHFYELAIKINEALNKPFMVKTYEEEIAILLKNKPYIKPDPVTLGLISSSTTSDSMTDK